MTGQASFGLAVSGGSGTGDVSYKVVSGNAVSVDERGVVSILRKGTAVVAVTKAEDGYYLTETAFVEITVRKAGADQETPMQTPVPSAAPTPVPTPVPSAETTPAVQPGPATTAQPVPSVTTRPLRRMCLRRTICRRPARSRHLPYRRTRIRTQSF